MILLLCKVPTFAQNIYNSIKEVVVINIDSNSRSFFSAKSNNGKEIYVLNYRLKLDKEYHSRIGDDADMMFTFYIAPKNKLQLKMITNPDEVFKNKIVNPVDAENKFTDGDYIDNFDFEPILKIKTNYYAFSNATILGQGFLIEEDPQYFPKFGAKSSKFKINLLSKPYSSKAIDSLRQIISKDSSAFKPFGTWVDDFYDKWLIKSINRNNKEIDFWISLKPVHDMDFTFGRVTSEIKYKIGVGVTEFSIIPFESEFSKDYFGDVKNPVKFYFKEFINLKELINAYSKN